MLEIPEKKHSNEESELSSEVIFNANEANFPVNEEKNETGKAPVSRSFENPLNNLIENLKPSTDLAETKKPIVPNDPKANLGKLLEVLQSEVVTSGNRESDGAFELTEQLENQNPNK